MTIQLSKTAVIVLSVSSAVVLLFSVGVVGYYHGFNLQHNEKKTADERAHRLFREKYSPQVNDEELFFKCNQPISFGRLQETGDRNLLSDWPRQEPAPEWFTQVTHLVGRKIRATGMLTYDGGH